MVLVKNSVPEGLLPLSSRENDAHISWRWKPKLPTKILCYARLTTAPSTPTARNTTENGTINSHSQDAAALQPEYIGRWSLTAKGLTFAGRAAVTVKVVLARRPQHGVTPQMTVVQPLESWSLEQCRCPVPSSLAFLAGYRW